MNKNRTVSIEETAKCSILYHIFAHIGTTAKSYLTIIMVNQNLAFLYYNLFVLTIHSLSFFRFTIFSSCNTYLYILLLRLLLYNSGSKMLTRAYSKYRVVLKEKPFFIPFTCCRAFYWIKFSFITH